MPNCPPLPCPSAGPPFLACAHPSPPILTTYTKIKRVNGGINFCTRMPYENARLFFSAQIISIVIFIHLFSGYTYIVSTVHYGLAGERDICLRDGRP